MSSVPESDFSFIRPLRPSKNPFSETELDIVHADTLDPLLRHDDALNAQEQERKNRYGGAKKRKRVLGDDGGRKITTKDAPGGPSLTKQKLKKRIHRDRSSSEMPSVPVTRFNIERMDSKTRAASSPPVAYLNTGRSEVNGFICESINFLHQFYDVEPTMEQFQISLLVPLHAIS